MVNRNEVSMMRRRRLAYGWSQKDFAEHAGVSQTLVSRFEKEEEITLVYLNALKKAQDDWWNALSSEERHRTKVLEMAYQLAESNSDAYTQSTLAYLLREISMYMVDLNRLPPRS